MCGASTKTYLAVVDDDESLCRSLARLLQASGFQPVTYLSAEAFLEDAGRPRFGCLIIDVQLGGMSGIELSERLAKAGMTTPVVFLSSHDESEVLPRLVETRMAGFVRKSDPGSSLIAVITKAVRASVATSPHH